MCFSLKTVEMKINNRRLNEKQCVYDIRDNSSEISRDCVSS